MTPVTPRIRPVRPDDAEAVHELRLAPQVMRFTSALPSEKLGHTRAFLERLGKSDHVFVAELDGELVGMAGLHVRDGKQRHTASLGMMVRDDYAGRGVGTALLEMLLDVADRWLGLRRVDLEVLADNDRAIRLYERHGFEREGTLRDAFFRDGAFVDAHVMSRLRR